jgi:Flp pilus assembly protein TadD
MRAIYVLAAFGIASLAVSTQVHADTLATCKAVKITPETVAACSEVITAGQSGKEDLARAYFNRGTIYLEQRLFDLALKDFERVVELNPRELAALNNRGVAFEYKGDREAAIAAYRKALDLAPGNVVILANLKRLGLTQ